MSKPENKQVPHASFHDERLDMAYWFPKLRDIDVPTPESQPLPIESREDKPPTWDTSLVSEIVENLGGEAFARSGYKSAQMSVEDGSHIHSPTKTEVDRTLRELVSQHIMMQMPLGESLWLREWLDLDWNAYGREQMNPEVRTFIRDGEIVCYHPRLEGFEGRSEDRSSAEMYIENAWPREVEHGFRDHEGLVVYAERVAEEFDGWWSVDFVMDRNKDWWCTDMAIDALYERDGEKRSISAHPGDCEHDVKE
jgi:hypothetical protein